MRKINVLIIGGLIGVCSAVSFVPINTAGAEVPGQQKQQPWPDGEPPKPKRGEAGERVMEVDRQEMEKFRKRVEMGRRENGGNRSEYLNRELTPAQKKLLSPATEDMARFAEFLKLPDTGLIRLLPKGMYESSMVVSAKDPNQDKVLPITGGGAAYSFTKKKHEFSTWSEIGLQDRKLFSGFAGGVLGFMTNLGDVPIDNVTLNSAGVDYLTGLVPPKNRSEAIEQSKRNGQEFTVGSFMYESILPAAPGSTYVLRSIAEGRADLLVAFRILRQDEDGSLIILWKELKRSSARTMK